MLYEVINATLDHVRLRLEHRDHLHDFLNELRVVVLPVGLHNGDDLAVDDSTALSFDVLVFLCRLVRNFVRCLLGNARRDQL